RRHRIQGGGGLPGDLHPYPDQHPDGDSDCGQPADRSGPLLRRQSAAADPDRPLARRGTGRDRRDAHGGRAWPGGRRGWRAVRRAGRTRLPDLRVEQPLRYRHALRGGHDPGGDGCGLRAAARLAAGLDDAVARSVGGPTAPPAGGTKIVIHGVAMDFRNPTDGAPLRVLEAVDLTVAPGEFVTLVGPSGCGKTTLLRVIDGLLAPSAGAVLIDEQPVRGPGPDRGFVFQYDSLLPWRTVRDNVLVGREIQRRLGPADREEARRYLRLVGLEGFERHA